jgi:hypothetical protein
MELKWVALGVVAGLGVLLAVVLAVIGVQRRRRQQWQRAALELGLAYSAEGGAFVARCAALKLFQKGHHRRAEVVLEGSLWGGPAVLADYRYTTGGGKSSKVHRQTICLLREPTLALPAFVLRREGVGDRLAQAVLGAADLDFADDAAFSRAWVLQGEDEEAVRLLFGPELRLSLLHAPALPVYVEARGDTLLVHAGRVVRPDSVRDLVQQAQSVMAMVRPHARVR